MKTHTKELVREAITCWLKNINETLEVANNVKVVDDLQSIEKYLPVVIKMIKLSYKNGFYGRLDQESLIRTTSRLKIVETENEVIACALYRGVLNSHKLSAICCDQTNDGKIALQDILKTDIQDKASWIWMEVSGPIEHYVKKYNGYPLPNYLVSKQLRKKDIDITDLSTDGFHYKRIIGNSGAPVEKVIFGFRNQEIANEVLADKDYEFKRKMFNLSEDDNSEIFVRNIDDATCFIDNLNDFYDENGWNELTANLAVNLDRSIEILQSNLSKEQYIPRYINIGKYLKERMPVIEKLTLDI